VLDLKGWWRKGLGLLAAFAVIQVLFSLKFGSFQIFSPFDQGLVYQAVTMGMIALGLNLIYGFNGQFSLGQYGFYGLGAYCSADITYRWVNGDARGLLVVLFGTGLGWLVIFGVRRLLSSYRRIPVLSSFTMYVLGTVAAWALAVWLGNLINPVFQSLVGVVDAPGILATGFPLQIVFFLAVVLAGACRCSVLAAIILESRPWASRS
jgi:branched-chain amino acid transport system permease protein